MPKGKIVEKVEEPVVEKIEEPPPVIEEPQFNPNQQRVLFPKLPVKKIVSYHSGTILADKEPSIELSEEKYQQIIKLFHDHAVDEVIPTSSLIDIVIQSGSFDKDRDFLQSVITQKLQQVFSPLSSVAPPPPPATLTATTATQLNSTTTTAALAQIEETLNEQKLLQFFVYFLAPAYYYGQRLRLYAGRGEKEQVKQLLYRQCSVNSANGEGLTPLHIAAENNQVEIIDILIDTAGIATPPAENGEGGSEGVIVNAQDKYGWTPLHCAVHNGHQETVKKLLSLSGINVEIPNNMGKTALHLACAQNRGLIVGHLLAAGAVLTTTDKRGMTPLHESAYRGRINVYRELSRDERADPSLKDDLGKVAADYLSAEEMKE